MSSSPPVMIIPKSPDLAPGEKPPIPAGTVMGWFLFVSSLMWPRLVILGFWIFDHHGLSEGFSSAAIPVIGFFVAPWTTMTYALVWGIGSDAVTGAGWIFVGLAAVLDLLTWFGGWRLLRR